MTRKGSLGPKKALANAKASRKACMARLRERVEQAVNLQRAQQLDSDDDSPMPSAKKAKAKANQEAHAPDNAPCQFGKLFIVVFKPDIDGKVFSRPSE